MGSDDRYTQEDAGVAGNQTTQPDLSTQAEDSGGSGGGAAASGGSSRTQLAVFTAVSGAFLVLAAVLLVLVVKGKNDGATVENPPRPGPAPDQVAERPPPASDEADDRCPPAEGTSGRITTFDAPPPTCIKPTLSYTAEVSTSAGDFVVDLDAEAAPETVNNFVVLARSHFYDGIPFHRVVPDFVIQVGDPADPNDLSQLGAGGPGYTIAEEPPAEGSYETYDLAMAKTQEPNSTGSQFFVITGDPAPLNASPTYSLFGRVTDGRSVVDAIASVGVVGPNGDTPDKHIMIHSVAITER